MATRIRANLIAFRTGFTVHHFQVISLVCRQRQPGLIPFDAFCPAVKLQGQRFIRFETGTDNHPCAFGAFPGGDGLFGPAHAAVTGQRGVPAFTHAALDAEDVAVPRRVEVHAAAAAYAAILAAVKGFRDVGGSRFQVIAFKLAAGADVQRRAGIAIVGNANRHGIAERYSEIEHHVTIFLFVIPVVFVARHSHPQARRTVATGV